MRLIYLGTTLILLFLSFLAGRSYNAASKNISNNTSKEQTTNKSLPIPETLADQRIHLWKEPFVISPDGRYKGESYMGNYADYYHYHQIFITDLTDNRMWRIYSGDFRTSDWKWTPDNMIKIFYNCGTACEATKIIGINENISLEDYENGGMNGKNGWTVQSFD